MSVLAQVDSPGLFVACFVLAAVLAFVVVPYCQQRHDEQRERQERERYRREHFHATEMYRRECEPVFEGLALMGNELDRT